MCVKVYRKCMSKANQMEVFGLSSAYHTEPSVCVPGRKGTEQSDNRLLDAHL